MNATLKAKLYRLQSSLSQWLATHHTASVYRTDKEIAFAMVNEMLAGLE